MGRDRIGLGPVANQAGTPMARTDQRHRRRAADIAVRTREEDYHLAFLSSSPTQARADASNRSRGAPWRPSFAKAFHEAPRTEAGRAAPGGAKVVAAPRGRMLPLARASGAARATGQSACANRLLRARCASRRSTAVSRLRRPARLGLKTALAPSAGSKSAGGVLPSEI